MIFTHSKFFFGFDVDSTNNAIDFSEGGPEIQATLNTGSYTMTEFVTELQRALNDVGGLTYTVSVNRDTRIFTIAATGTFELLVSTGSRQGTNAYVTAGFTGADRTGAATYDGNSAAENEYVTQFHLQAFVDQTDNRQAAFASVNKSASGQVEVVKFGEERFYEMDFQFITDVAQPAASPIRNRPTGVADFRTFIQFMVTKAPFEFMPDEDTTSTFFKVILESTPASKDGVGYKLNELFTRGLTNYYNSGLIRLRIQN